MKIKACLVGISTTLLVGHADGWRIFDFIANLFKPPAPPAPPAPAPVLKPTPAPTAKPTPVPTAKPSLQPATAAPLVVPTLKPATFKTISLRTKILPQWNQIAPPAALSIKLSRVIDFWRALESGDIEAYGGVFGTEAERTATANKVKAYYDVAVQCLGASSLSERVTINGFSARMLAVSKCVATTSAPQFVVLDTVAVVPAQPSYDPSKYPDSKDYESVKPATTAPPVTKTIYMRAGVVPTWQQVAPPGARTIRLQRVTDFWRELESGDVKTYGSVTTIPKESSSPAAAITEYYDRLRLCLADDSVNDRLDELAFMSRMLATSKCAAQLLVPKFVTVANMVDVTPAPPSYKPESHLDLDDYAVESEATELHEETVYPVDIALQTYDD